MSFGLGINQIATTSKWAGVEVNAVNEISNNIFTRAAKVEAIDLSKANLNSFKRAELGIDLYSGKTSVEAQKQISLLNSGALQTPVAAVNTLNAQAASTLYPPMNVQRAVEQTAVQTSTELFSSSVSKDKKGSNPFLFSSNNQNAQTEKTEGLNLFA